MKWVQNITKNQRGGVTVAIALMMAVVLFFVVIQSIFIWGQTLTAEETDRLHETVSIQQIYPNNSSELVLQVKNTGGVNTRLVAVWVEPSTAPNETQRVTIDEYVNIEEVKEIVLDTSILNASSIIDLHTFTVVTERGNVASGEYPVETLPYIPEVHYLGVFGVDWFYCKYASQQNPPNGSELLDAVYIVKSEDYIAFYLNITNSYDQAVSVSSDSFLALTTIAPPQGQGVPSFFLVQNASYDGTPTLTSYDDDDPYVVLPNQSQVVIFAAETLGSADWQWGYGYPFGPETTTEGSDIQISLFYELLDGELNPTGRFYGQSISTHAVTLLAK
jgi:hypothetical protein